VTQLTPEEIEQQREVMVDDIYVDTDLDSAVVKGTLIAYAILCLLGLITFKLKIFEPIEGFRFDLGPGLILLVLLHSTASWLGQEVDVKDYAYRSVFGKPTRELKTGFQFMPWGVMKKHTLKDARDLIQIQAPAPPELIQWTDEKIPLEPGMFRPLYVISGPPDENGNPDDLMNKRAQFGISYYGTATVDNALRFLIRFGTVEKFIDFAREYGDSSLNVLFQDKSASAILDNRQQISDRFDNQIRNRTRNLGVRIHPFEVTAYNLSHELAAAMRDYVEVGYRVKTGEAEAGLARVRLTEEGEGKAAAEKAMLLAKADGEAAMLTARANGLKQIKEGLPGADDSEILIYDASDELARNANLILGATGGYSDIASMIALNKRMTDKTPKKDDDK